MSEDDRPKLRRPGTDDQKDKGSSKLDPTIIREKLGSLKNKKPETNIKNKVSSFKLKSRDRKEERKGPLKIRTPTNESRDTSRSKKITQDTVRILGKKPVFSIIGIIILIILVVSVAMWAVADKKPIINQSNNTTNQTEIQKNHFSDGNISFDYPEGWNVTNSTGSTSSQYSLIVTVSKDENNSFSVFKETLGAQNFTYEVAAWRSNIMQNGMIYYEGDLTVDNTTAYELEANYKPNDKVYTTRGIAFEKNNTAYFLIFVFDEALLDYKNEMDKILNSFHVMEKVQN